MKNFIQEGKVIPAVAPAGGYSSGDPVEIGELVGIASKDAAEGETVEVALEGVFQVPKEAALAVTKGDILYFDSAEGEFDKTNTNTKAGYAFADAAGADSTVLILLAQ